MTTYREACGTFMGARLHQTAGEELCGDCAFRERMRLLELERFPSTRDTSCGNGGRGLSTAQAKANRAQLAAAIGEPDDYPQGGSP